MNYLISKVLAFIVLPTCSRQIPARRSPCRLQVGSTLKALASALLCVLCASALNAATVVFQFQSPFGQSTTPSVSLTPLSVPTAQSNTLVLSGMTTFAWPTNGLNTDTWGNVTFFGWTNNGVNFQLILPLSAGAYQANVQGFPKSWGLTVPVSTNTYYASDLSSNLIILSPAPVIFATSNILALIAANADTNGAAAAVGTTAPAAMTNQANQFTGSFIGNGGGLTNLNLAAILSPTNTPLIYYFADGGSDSSGQTNNPLLPFKTFAQHMTTNANFIFSAGNFTNNSPGTSQCFSSVNFAGAGRTVTILTFNGNSALGNNECADESANFSDLTYQVTTNSTGTFPFLLGWQTYSHATSNTFERCSLSGINDLFIVRTDTNHVLKVYESYLKSGWDIYASALDATANYGFTTNSLFALYDCQVDINTNYSGPSNSAQAAHLFNAVYSPSLDIENSFIKITGYEAAIIATNGTYGNPFRSAITNSSLTLINDHFVLNFQDATNSVGPDKLLAIYQHATTNILIRNVSWTSNGTFYALPDYPPVRGNRDRATMNVVAESSLYSGTGFLAVTNYSLNNNVGFSVNLAKGVATNLIEQDVAVSFSATIGDNAVSGSTVQATILTNGVSAFVVSPQTSIDSVAEISSVQPISFNNLFLHLKVGDVVALGIQASGTFNVFNASLNIEKWP